MNQEETVDPLIQLLGAPDLPAETGTVVATWFTTGTVRATMSRFIRCNETRWRQLEDPGAKFTDAQMLEVLALAEGWSVCGVPTDYVSVLVVETF